MICIAIYFLCFKVNKKHIKDVILFLDDFYVICIDVYVHYLFPLLYRRASVITLEYSKVSL